MVWLRTFSRFTPSDSRTPAGDAFTFTDQPQQQVLGADVVMPQSARLIHRQLDHLLGARVRPISPARSVAVPNDELDGAAHFVELDA